MSDIEDVLDLQEEVQRLRIENERLRADNQRMRELLLEWGPDERARSFGW
jgi:hypothetical protein